MSKYIERAKAILPSLENDPEGSHWDAFIEEASMAEPDDIYSLLTKIAELQATIERVRGLSRWEVGDENRLDIVYEDGEFVRWADVQETIK